MACEVKTPERAPRGHGSLLHPAVERVDGAGIRSNCVWCSEKVTARTGVKLSDVLTNEALARALTERTNRTKLCRGCGVKLKKLWDRCMLGLDGHESIRNLVVAAVTARGISGQERVVLVDSENVSVHIHVQDDGQECWYPLSMFKRTCNLYWGSDRRWRHMVNRAATLDAYSQIFFAQQMMKLPFGRKPPFPASYEVLPVTERNTLERIFEQNRSVDVMAHMLWQYLTREEPDDPESLGKETDFNMSFALWFLIDSCCRTWSIDMTSALKTCYNHRWTTTWGPVALINMVYAIETEGPDSFLIELSRQAPIPEKQSIEGAAERNALVKQLQQLVRSQATLATIIIFYAPLGQELLSMVRSYAPYATIPQTPMSVSFIFCELRKNGDTGVADVLLRHRDQWDSKDAREALTESMHSYVAIKIPVLHKGLTWEAAKLRQFPSYSGKRRRVNAGVQSQR